MSRMKIDLPILYSKRNCPFCQRARAALAISRTMVALHEVDLKAKPLALLQASPKGSVPVLVLTDGQVLEESIEIMHWALRQNDPAHWMDSPLPDEVSEGLVEACDRDFAAATIRLKYPDRFNDSGDPKWLTQAEDFIAALEERLSGVEETGLGGSKGMRVTDIAILPFLLQYAELESGTRLDGGRFPKTAQWVKRFGESPLYRQIMTEYPVWQEGMEPLIFPA